MKKLKFKKIEFERYGIDKKQFLKWIEALRSGKYQQTKQTLQGRIGPDISGYCCLGVACEVLIPEDAKIKHHGELYGGTPEDQPSAPEWLKKIDRDFTARTAKSLMGLNDNDGLTFDQIADCLEAVYVHGVLEKPLPRP